MSSATHQQIRQCSWGRFCFRSLLNRCLRHQTCRPQRSESVSAATITQDWRFFVRCIVSFFLAFTFHLLGMLTCDLKLASNTRVISLAFLDKRANPPFRSYVQVQNKSHASEGRVPSAGLSACYCASDPLYTFVFVFRRTTTNAVIRWKYALFVLFHVGFQVFLPPS